MDSSQSFVMKGFLRRSPRGFTMVEVVLSLVVLGVALVPLINLFYEGAERNKLVPQVVASLLAAEKMEESIASRALQGWTNFTVSPSNYSNIDSTNFPGYQWKVEVVNVQRNDFNQVVGSSTGYKRITVFVKRPDNEEHKLTTIVTDY
ncbi:MAG: prepilin-type N-terminal cleavage/methylation domain-containing protein [Deltaproteobacteria bacterium]|nr:prepilin-type N-terminal cleavage/methylation domain-containing protein [Deltaproteobacteria bacterium]